MLLCLSLYIYENIKQQIKEVFFMKIGIIGTGYVGLPTGVGLAELGNEVICIDKDANKIKALKNGKLTIFEDGLDELFKKNVRSGSLQFTTSMKEGIKNADLIMIAVGTPPHPITKEADMKYIHEASKELAIYLKKYTVIATKSTVPVGTGNEIEEIIKTTNPQAEFDVVSLPEFLREGFAIHDFFNPDRIVIGANSQRAKQVFEELYSPFKDKCEILYVNRKSSETIKYASNAFLAIKIHYINEVANFCEKAGADIYEVAKGMGLDSRIGNKFLNAGPGYGGSCFPKDTNAMAYMGRKYGADLSLVESAIVGNDNRISHMAEKALKYVRAIQNPKVAIWGLAFKGGTDDCRESPAMKITQKICETRFDINVYDPQAMDKAKAFLGDRVSYAKDEYEAVKNADILVVLTEWEDFRNADLSKVKSLMKSHNIVDLRNMLCYKTAKELGFTYECIGRK